MRLRHFSLIFLSRVTNISVSSPPAQPGTPCQRVLKLGSLLSSRAIAGFYKDLCQACEDCVVATIAQVPQV
jgi:hypothetical protein